MNTSSPDVSPASLQLACLDLQRVARRCLDLEVAAQQSVLIISALFGAEGASMTALDGGKIRYVAACGVVESMRGETRPLIDSFTGDVILTKRAKVFSPVRARPMSRGLASLHQINSGMVAPILDGGSVIGTIGVVSHRPGKWGSAALGPLAELAAALTDTYSRHPLRVSA